MKENNNGKETRYAVLRIPELTKKEPTPNPTVLCSHALIVRGEISPRSPPRLQRKLFLKAYAIDGQWRLRCCGIVDRGNVSCESKVRKEEHGW